MYHFCPTSYLSAIKMAEYLAGTALIQWIHDESMRRARHSVPMHR